MLKLGGNALEWQPVAAPVASSPTALRGPVGSGPVRELLRVCTQAQEPPADRSNSAWLVQSEGTIPTGFACYLLTERSRERLPATPNGAPYMVLSDEFTYLTDGDIVRVNRARGSIGVLFRRNSDHNTLLVTEQCNHYCLMCSQPPKRQDDRWLIQDAQRLVPMLPTETVSIGISGGEPTLLGDDLLELLRLLRVHLPQTSVDLLSNGRKFADPAFATAYASIDHPALTVGIPVYSDDPATHDHIVQASGAFDETIRGVLNLKRLNQRVEIRVVLHALSIPRLPELARYIARNLLFVDHVALMGLEMTGFTLANMAELWIDPYDYQDHLARAVTTLREGGMNVSVYNLPLCTMPAEAMPVYRKSISDWKNEYLPTCDSCSQKSACGGFFSSAIKHRVSSHIVPL